MDKYEKALELARNYYPDNLFLDTIFPELAESEDDGIRKELIALFRDSLNHRYHPYSESDAERWVAYLEKQKEQT